MYVIMKTIREVWVREWGKMHGVCAATARLCQSRAFVVQGKTKLWTKLSFYDETYHDINHFRDDHISHLAVVYFILLKCITA